ncbi:cytochrome c-type biogenesis protein [Segnochrobactraceae bacterium EtOH-i3]
MTRSPVPGKGRAVLLALALSVSSLAAPVVLAVQPDEILVDPVAEARARELSARLRCMVCQNQSIDDSDAPLARDLRLLVRERIEAGDSNDQVLDFLVTRYGEFVLLKPTFALHNLVLWLAAPLVLLGGGVLAWKTLRTRPAGPQPLTPEEEAEIARVLKERGDDADGKDGSPAAP